MEALLGNEGCWSVWALLWQDGMWYVRPIMWVEHRPGTCIQQGAAQSTGKHGSMNRRGHVWVAFTPLSWQAWKSLACCCALNGTHTCSRKVGADPPPPSTHEHRLRETRNFAHRKAACSASLATANFFDPGILRQIGYKLYARTSLGLAFLASPTHTNQPRKYRRSLLLCYSYSPFQRSVCSLQLLATAALASLLTTPARVTKGFFWPTTSSTTFLHFVSITLLYQIYTVPPAMCEQHVTEQAETQHICKANITCSMCGYSCETKDEMWQHLQNCNIL
ncbi:hypothetical protein GQ54DRAFT_211061 [Martensiomyces pterosporus]|nr:hypothetical protein GQ54DRAFT_211061 [Martensiomyces pterosporus]